MGIVYLLQPQKYLDTNVYKIGMSSKNKLDRPRNYGSKSEILLIMNCFNPLHVERKLRFAFNKKFEKCEGNEYFQGNITEMKKIFVNIVMKDKRGLNYKLDLTKFKKELKQNIELEQKNIINNIKKHEFSGTKRKFEELTTNKNKKTKIEYVNSSLSLKNQISKNSEIIRVDTYDEKQRLEDDEDDDEDDEEDEDDEDDEVQSLEDEEEEHDYSKYGKIVSDDEKDSEYLNSNLGFIQSLAKNYRM